MKQAFLVAGVMLTRCCILTLGFSVPQNSPRLPSNSWRLAQADTPMPPADDKASPWGIHHVAPSISTDPRPIKGSADTVDMSSFESSYQGLTRQSKAGLALAVFMTAGLIYSAPDLHVASTMSSLVDWESLGFDGSGISNAWDPLQVQISNWLYSALPSSTADEFFQNAQRVLSESGLQLNEWIESANQNAQAASSVLSTSSDQLLSHASEHSQQLMRGLSMQGQQVTQELSTVSQEIGNQVHEAVSGAAIRSEQSLDGWMPQIRTIFDEVGIQGQSLMNQISAETKDTLAQLGRTSNDVARKAAYGLPSKGENIFSAMLTNSHQVIEQVLSNGRQLVGGVAPLAERVTTAMSIQTGRLIDQGQELIAQVTTEAQLFMHEVSTKAEASLAQLDVTVNEMTLQANRLNNEFLSQGKGVLGEVFDSSNQAIDEAVLRGKQFAGDLVPLTERAITSISLQADNFLDRSQNIMTQTQAQGQLMIQEVSSRYQEFMNDLTPQGDSTLNQIRVQGHEFTNQFEIESQQRFQDFLSSVSSKTQTLTTQGSEAVARFAQESQQSAEQLYGKTQDGLTALSSNTKNSDVLSTRLHPPMPDIKLPQLSMDTPPALSQFQDQATESAQAVAKRALVDSGLEDTKVIAHHASPALTSSAVHMSATGPAVDPYSHLEELCRSRWGS